MHVSTHTRMDPLTYESMDVSTHTHKHALMHVCMHACMHVLTYICCLLAVGCYSGIMRTRPKLLETALRQYITRETGVDLIRVGEIEVRVSAFVQVLYFPTGVFHCCLLISIFKLFLQLEFDM